MLQLTPFAKSALSRILDVPSCSTGMNGSHEPCSPDTCAASVRQLHAVQASGGVATRSHQSTTEETACTAKPEGSVPAVPYRLLVCLPRSRVARNQQLNIVETPIPSPTRHLYFPGPRSRMFQPIGCRRGWVCDEPGGTFIRVSRFPGSKGHVLVVPMSFTLVFAIITLQSCCCDEHHSHT